MMTMSWMFSLLTMIPFTVLRRAMRQDYYWYHLVSEDMSIRDVPSVSHACNRVFAFQELLWP